MNSNEMISLYEGVSELSGEMLVAARSSDWEKLRRLEVDCATRLDGLKTGCPALTGEQRVRKLRLLQTILSNDREIRNIMEPSMANMALLMQGGDGHAARRCHAG